jgi:hypothetical protein
MNEPNAPAPEGENQLSKLMNESESTEMELYHSDPPYFYHRDPGYKPWLIAKMPRKPTPYEEILAMMARHVDYAVIGSRCALVFAVLIVLDFTLPKTHHEVNVVGYKRSPAGTYQMRLNDSSVINVSKKAMRTLKGKFLTVARTKFFQVPYRLTDQQNNNASVEISIYGNFIFGPIVLLLTSLTGVVRKKGVELRFNLGVASVVLVFLNISFLLVHRF